MRSKTVDTLLHLINGTYTGADAGQVDGVDKILDIGSGRFDAIAQIDISALAIDGGDENYNLHIEGSNSATFASGIVTLASLNVGDSAVNLGDADDTVGRYEVPFCNERDGVMYRYLRANLITAGVTVSITLDAYVVKH